MTPLIFSRYVAESRVFTSVNSEQALAATVGAELAAIVGGEDVRARGVYMGRVGFGPAPDSRSTRPALETLLLNGGATCEA
jgi:hypothetical protein